MDDKLWYIAQRGGRRCGLAKCLSRKGKRLLMTVGGLLWVLTALGRNFSCTCYLGREQRYAVFLLLTPLKKKKQKKRKGKEVEKRKKILRMVVEEV